MRGKTAHTGGIFALGGAGAAAAGLSLAKAMSGGRVEPNLLVIITDDQPYYTVSHTKAVASLIRDRGTTFSPYAYVSTPMCGPARATLLTGKWSRDRTYQTAGAYQDLHASIYESYTIATRLKQAGYSTYFRGKYTNGYDGNAIPSGWDAWFAMVEPINKADSFLYRNSSRTRRYNREVHNETDVLSVNAERFVRDQAGSSVPWFAYVPARSLTRPTTCPQTRRRVHEYALEEHPERRGARSLGQAKVVASGGTLHRL